MHMPHDFKHAPAIKPAHPNEKPSTSHPRDRDVSNAAISRCFQVSYSTSQSCLMCSICHACTMIMLLAHVVPAAAPIRKVAASAGRVQDSKPKLQQIPSPDPLSKRRRHASTQYCVPGDALHSPAFTHGVHSERPRLSWQRAASAGLSTLPTRHKASRNASAAVFTASHCARSAAVSSESFALQCCRWCWQNASFSVRIASMDRRSLKRSSPAYIRLCQPSAIIESRRIHCLRRKR